MLILLPNLLDESASFSSLSQEAISAAGKISGLFAESEKEGRRFLKNVLGSPSHVPLQLLNEHSPISCLEELLKPVYRGEIWGLVTDCGLPCLADPGSLLVGLARKKHIPIQAYMGPSAVILTLMLSGLPSQSFTFHGYLPRDRQELGGFLRKLSRGHTHLAIEAPYRSDSLGAFLVDQLPDNSVLCVAVDLTSSKENVTTCSISDWRRNGWCALGKRPTTFAFYIPAT